MREMDGRWVTLRSQGFSLQLSAPCSHLLYRTCSDALWLPTSTLSLAFLSGLIEGNIQSANAHIVYKCIYIAIVDTCRTDRQTDRKGHTRYTNTQMEGELFRTFISCTNFNSSCLESSGCERVGYHKILTLFFPHWCLTQCPLWKVYQ